MNENITPWNVQTPSSGTGGLEAAASEFKSKVEDAATRLSGAAQQFVSMSEAFASAIEEARQAANQAQEARRGIEELKERMERDYGSVEKLVADLQERISALATLARPFPAPEAQQESTHQEAPVPINQAANNMETSSW